jgi:hypothetical protein
MTELQRVNLVLAATGDPPITSGILAALSEPDAVEIQARLTAKSEQCQRSIPWALHQATDMLTVAAGTLRWQPGDEIAQATSLATGVVLMIDAGTTAWVRKDDDSPADFDSSHTITGQGDIAWTRTVSARTALPLDKPWSIDYLTTLIQEYITRDCAVEWQRYKKRGQVDDQAIGQQAMRARIDALRENQQIDQACFIGLSDIFEVRGKVRDAEYTGMGDIDVDGN